MHQVIYRSLTIANVVDIDRFLHCTPYGVLATGRQRGRKRGRRDCLCSLYKEDISVWYVPLESDCSEYLVSWCRCCDRKLVVQTGKHHSVKAVIEFIWYIHHICL